MTQKMPSNRSRIAHLQPYWRGNSLGGITTASRRGYKYMDQDVNLTRDLVRVVAHWPKFYKDGFLWEAGPHVKGARKVQGEWLVRHKMPLATTYSDLPWSRVKNLRRLNGGRVYTVRTHMARAYAVKMHLMFEIKGDSRFAHPIVVRGFQADSTATHCAFSIMTLQNLGKPFERLLPYYKAGIETILLARGRGVPKAWEPAITYVRGRWRRV